MTTNRDDTTAILAAVHETTVFVRVSGRGTFKNGATLKQFALQSIREGCSSFVFDLCDCTGMDSTFMGVLAGMAIRLKRESDSPIILINLSDKLLDLLQTLGLNHLLELHTVGDIPNSIRKLIAGITGGTTLQTGCESEQFKLETVLEAHQKLVEASADNLPKFKSVIDLVSRDLERFNSQ